MVEVNLRAKLKAYKRVLQIARKPSRDEFTTAGKVCAIGIFLIGMIGFLIFLVFIFAGI